MQWKSFQMKLVRPQSLALVAVFGDHIYCVQENHTILACWPAQGHHFTSLWSLISNQCKCFTTNLLVIQQKTLFPNWQPMKAFHTKTGPNTWITKHGTNLLNLADPQWFYSLLERLHEGQQPGHSAIRSNASVDSHISHQGIVTSCRLRQS